MSSYLWTHEDETKGVDCADQRVEDPGVPGLVGLILQGIDGITDNDGVERVAEVHHRLLVILLRLCVPAMIQ